MEPPDEPKESQTTINEIQVLRIDTLDTLERMGTVEPNTLLNYLSLDRELREEAQRGAAETERLLSRQPSLPPSGALDRSLTIAQTAESTMEWVLRREGTRPASRSINILQGRIREIAEQMSEDKPGKTALSLYADSLEEFKSKGT